MENKLFSAYLVTQKEKFSEKSFGREVLDSFSKKGQAKENKISKDFLNFFQTECETAIDSLDNFFGLSREERSLALKTFKQR
jgi:hypothetical protein